MINVNRNLDRESLVRLASLRGQRWRCFGGQQVSDWMTDVSLFVLTEESALTISGEVDELDFEGEEDSYSRLRVDQGAADLGAAKKSGNTYHFYASQEVRDVLVVRETVEQNIDGEPTWTCTTDIAIVFVLGSGVLAVAMVSHHSELLAAVRADDVESLTIEEPSNLWTDKLGVEHRFTRDMVPIGDLLHRTTSDGGPINRTSP